MYQFDNTKRYNVIVNQHDNTNFCINFSEKNVELLAVAPNFVALKDNNGKEHIYTGDVGISIVEAD